MRLAVLLAAALLTGCAAAPSPPPSPAPVSDNAGGCAVKVGFGSYAMGVDHELATRMEEAIGADKRVESVSRRAWGREGEFDLCLTLKPGASAHDVFQALGAMLQGRGEKAPTSVSLASGETVSTPARP